MAPVIVEPKEDDTPLLLKIGDPLNISCVAKGNPAPNVIWLNNNTGNAVSSTSTNSQRLIINSIEDKDFGFYTCIASSKLNYAMVSVEIKEGKFTSRVDTYFMVVSEGWRPGFTPPFTSIIPSYFHRKHKENRMKRTS